MRSGLAMEMQISSKLCALPICPKMLMSSFMISSFAWPSCLLSVDCCPAVPQDRWLSSTLRQSDFSSLTRTLKDSGMPASNVSSPRTIDS